ncbi:MAG: hypothetical protein AAGF79_00070 [Pseudomonadota bacterium]
MEWIRAGLLVVLALGLCVGTGAPLRAAEVQCGPPLDWQNLSNLTRRLVREAGASESDAPRTISAELRDMNWQRIRAWQGQTARPDVTQLMKQSVEELRNYASTGQFSLPWLLIEKLDQIDHLAAELCVEIPNAEQAADGAGAPKLNSRAGFGLSPNGGTLADYARLSLLPLVVALLAVAVKAGHIGLKWTQTWRNVRRACDVSATLHIGPYTLPGTITLLGLRGCRFVGADETRQSMLAVVAGSADARLSIDEFQINTEVVALHANWSALSFDAPLSKETHAAILERSRNKARTVALPPLEMAIHRAPASDGPDAGSQVERTSLQ